MIVKDQGTIFLGGPPLVKAATGEVVTAEELGGASMHNQISGVAHFEVPDDEACVAKIRELVSDLSPARLPEPVDEAQPPARKADEAYDLMPQDHRQPYKLEAVLETFLDAVDSLSAELAPAALTAD